MNDEKRCSTKPFQTWRRNAAVTDQFKKLSLLLLLLSTLALSSSAAEEQEKLAVRTLRSDPCFSTQRFIKRVNARLTTVKLSDQGRNPSLDVQVIKAHEAYTAELTIRFDDGELVHRSLSASSCDEATEALAFVASVALDGEENVKASATAPQQYAPRERSALGVVGAGANMLVFALPKVALGPELVLFLGQVSPGWWSPSLRLGLQYHRVGEVEHAAGTASFQLLTSQLQLCPSQAHFSAFSFRPCAHASGGWLRAQGSETNQAQSSDRPFVTAGAALLAHVELHHYLQLMAQGTISFPLIRDRFQFDDDIFHQARLVNYGLGASLGFRFY